MTRVPSPPSTLRSRLIAAVLAAGLLLVPTGGAALGESSPTGTSGATTPTTPATTPTPTPTATTPDATTPTTPVDPMTLTLGKPATFASAQWSIAPQFAEEQMGPIRVTGVTDGQLTFHATFLGGVNACPLSPLYPQIASGRPLQVTQIPGTGTAEKPVAATFDYTIRMAPPDAGGQRFCGWLVASPPLAGVGATISRLDVPISVTSQPGVVGAIVPGAARSGDYFSVTLNGATAGRGRRALIMADPDRGQNCALMMKRKSRALQRVTSLPAGSFSKTVRVRFKKKTAGPYRLCVQIVERADRVPEAASATIVLVTEQMKCVATQQALARRRADLQMIRGRRDRARQRYSDAKAAAKPLRKKIKRLKQRSGRKISKARKAARKAKTAAGRKKLNRKLAKLRRSEKRKLYKASRPLRKANAKVRYQQRRYKEYRTGSRLLLGTISRTKKDARKYCANP